MKTRCGHAGFLLIQAVGLSIATGQDVSSQPSIPSIIERIAEQEQHYENMEVLASYQHLNPGGGRFSYKSSEGAGTAIFPVIEQKTIRYVDQNDRFRVDCHGEAAGGAEVFTLNQTLAYDSRQTRLFEEGQPMQLIPGLQENQDLLRPHMLRLRFMMFNAPLSTYLAGHQAMRSHQGTHWESSHVLEVTYHGRQQYQGLTCHKVWVTTCIPAGKPHDRWELLLAEERNLIPVRSAGYTLHFSESLPLLEATVTDWKELEQVSWFPMETEIQAYDRFAIRDRSVKVLSWRHELTAKNVSLHPSYQPAWFEGKPAPLAP